MIINQALSAKLKEAATQGMTAKEMGRQLSQTSPDMIERFQTWVNEFGPEENHREINRAKFIKMSPQTQAQRIAELENELKEANAPTAAAVDAEEEDEDEEY